MVRRQPIPAAVEATLEFGRFRVLLRRRQLLGDSGPIELGTRAFDLLLVLLEANGLLVTKGELLSRVWPGIVVVEDNLSRPSRNQTGISNALHPRPYGLFLDDLPIHIRPDLPAARVQT